VHHAYWTLLRTLRDPAPTVLTWLDHKRLLHDHDPADDVAWPAPEAEHELVDLFDRLPPATIEAAFDLALARYVDLNEEYHPAAEILAHNLGEWAQAVWMLATDPPIEPYFLEHWWADVRARLAFCDAADPGLTLL